MPTNKSNLGMLGILFGAAALLLALASFWAGPFAPKPTLESVIEAKAESIRLAAIDVLNGKEVAKSYDKIHWDIDRVIALAIPILGVLALALGLLGFISSAPKTSAVAAVILGGGAVAFQLMAKYVLS